MVQASNSDALLGAERDSQERLIFRQLCKTIGVTLEVGDNLITNSCLLKSLLKLLGCMIVSYANYLHIIKFQIACRGMENPRTLSVPRLVQSSCYTFLEDHHTFNKNLLK